MGKRSSIWTKEKLDRYIKQGRGQGELENYKPWLNTQDFSSKGRASRILGNTTKRVHHFFSDLESKCFYIWDWEENVIDIREHYPLINLEDLVNVNDINLGLFKDKHSSVQYILCTTFLLTIKDFNGNKKCCARSVKYKNELLKRTTLERLELERRYWNYMNIDWGIITEDEVQMEKVRNIEWIHDVMNQYSKYDIDKKEMVSLCSKLIIYLEVSRLPLKKCFKDFDSVNGLKIGTSIFLFKYLIGSRFIKINLDKAINLNLTYREVIE